MNNLHEPLSDEQKKVLEEECGKYPLQDPNPITFL